MTQAYLEKMKSECSNQESNLKVLGRKVLGSTPDRSTQISFYPSMPVSLSSIIHHSHSFTRLENIPSHLFHNCYLLCDDYYSNII